jgi:hypothetical protein
MRASIEHKEIASGLIKKVPQVEVTVAVQLSEEERAIVERWNLGERVVVERQINAHRLGKMKADQYDYEANLEHLRIAHLLRGPNRYVVDTPLDAKVYQNEVVEGLKSLKSFLAGCAELAEPQSLEI